jgi:hypothetical protein
MNHDISSRHIKQMFPKIMCNEFSLRLKFIRKLYYLNNWNNLDDYEYNKHLFNPDYEKLFNNYIKTDNLPYFSKNVISFVKDIDNFIITRKSTMYIIIEDLLINWSCY